MDFWAIIGIVSSLLGIFSFLKNDTSLFKKIQIGACELNIKKPNSEALRSFKSLFPVISRYFPTLKLRDGSFPRLP